MNEIKLDLFDDIISGTFTEKDSWKEFEKDLEAITEYTNNELFIEAVGGKDIGTRRLVKNVATNTAKTVKDTGELMGYATDIGASSINSRWNLCTSGIRLIARLAGFISRNIDRLFVFVSRSLDKVGNLPSDIKNRIKGNIPLYITADDIQDLYTRSLLMKLNNYMELAQTLTSGNTWATFFNKRDTVFTKEDNVKGGYKNETLSLNDIKLCKKMLGEYKAFASLTFNQTYVQMSSESIVELYFGNSKSIKFTDLSGKNHECTYAEALNQLINDLKIYIKPIQTIQKSLGEKLTESQGNGSFSRLSTGNQNLIVETIQSMSKSIQIISSIIKYINDDIKTINKKVEQAKITTN